jgi:hypothetical protein
MQLVAFGAQDVYLSGTPKVTFFQAAYKRHTNFAMETVQQTVQGAGGNGGLFSVTLSRSGDLVGDMFVALTPTVTSAAQLTSNNTGADMCWVAERAFNTIELYIGGQLIDKHYQLWFRLYSEVFMDDTKRMAYGRMTSMPIANNVGVTSVAKVYLPLLFFFNRNPGLYLPLIALQYHEVRLDFSLTNYYSSYFGTNPIDVWANYMYLEEQERGRFSKNNHEYLIEQVQHVAGDPIISSSENSPAIVRMQYNHPVKELIWVYQDPAPLTNRNAMWNFTSGVSNVNVTCDPSKLAGSLAPFAPNTIGAPFLSVPLPFSSNLYLLSNVSVTSNATSNLIQLGSNIAVQSNVLAGNVFMVESGLANVSTNVTFGYEVGPLHKAKFLLNGTERAAEQLGKYFNQYQPFQHHDGSPSPGIYVYSFALKPEDHQPSGACNFSRIDMAQIAVSLKTGMPSNLLQQMFAVNYNVLRIASGLGGLAFSN